MKILTKVLLLVAFVSISSMATAQNLKIGYIDSNEIMGVMPERDTIENKLVLFEQQLETELRTMATEYQKRN
jgi:Skp family chaperone for outer membrane proteins